MRRILLLIAIVVQFNVSCNNDNLDCTIPPPCPVRTFCNVENPLEELIWLIPYYENVKNSASPYDKVIYYRLFDGQEIIDVTTEMVGTIYNCKGEVLCQYGGFSPTFCDSIRTIRTIKESYVLYPE